MSQDKAPLPSRTSAATGWNQEYMEAMYVLWQSNPKAVDESWQLFFEGFALAMGSHSCVAAEQAQRQSRVASLIYAYRGQGHRLARVDPLSEPPASLPQLTLQQFDLEEQELDHVFDTGHLRGGPARATLREIIAILKETYCGSIGVEYLHIQEVAIRRWLQQQMEPVRNHPPYDRQKKQTILRLLVDAELFETFVGTRYPGQKRFSLEGAEALIPAIHELTELAPDLGLEELVLGMSHRGRLNVLANILDKSYAMIFSEFEENVIPALSGGDGDVKYHKGFSADHASHRTGRVVHLSLTANPSHLEAVDPVVEGRARAKQRRRQDTAERKKVLPLLIHGDAAFSGQGLVAETLNLSQLEGYRTGGTVHLVVNNQIGFTTLPSDARSTPYATDVAKMIEAPIFHVNGDDPEAVVYATELALRFRQAFGRDVVVDIICYRRHGHNEGDEPAFTQPMLYRRIKDHPSVRRLYAQRLLTQGDLSEEEAQKLATDFKAQLQQAFQTVKTVKITPPLEQAQVQAYDKQWQGLNQPYSDAAVETGVKQEQLVEVARALYTVPAGFALNPKVARQLPDRLGNVVEQRQVDWATAEGLAYGSLLQEGTPVRLSGQDSARGTFSHRHAIWQDMNTQESYTPANHIHPQQGRFCVYNSMLSEAAVLGFEYGYSLEEPHMLIIWEAQFGDFANGAQVILDQFIFSSAAKWQRGSGLTLLLPHGYEGQGPEHSNAYLERYLMACAEENIQVCNLTTPAQLFHVLRRQVKRPFRRPLIIMSPKSLLRHSRVISPVAELVGGHFQEILDDPAPPTAPQRLLLCSGKIYYDLLEGKDRGLGGEVVIVRLEQLYPFSRSSMERIIQHYPTIKEVCWVQEEPQNRGAWTYLRALLPEFFRSLPLHYVGRKASASPATGSHRHHQQEQADIVQRALLGLVKE